MSHDAYHVTIRNRRVRAGGVPVPSDGIEPLAPVSTDPSSPIHSTIAPSSHVHHQIISAKWRRTPGDVDLSAMLTHANPFRAADSITIGVRGTYNTLKEHLDFLHLYRVNKIFRDFLRTRAHYIECCTEFDERDSITVRVDNQLKLSYLFRLTRRPVSTFIFFSSLSTWDWTVRYLVVGGSVDIAQLTGADLVRMSREVASSANPYKNCEIERVSEDRYWMGRLV